MGTIGFYFEDEAMELPNTTPEILTIYKLLIHAMEKRLYHSSDGS